MPINDLRIRSGPLWDNWLYRCANSVGPKSLAIIMLLVWVRPGLGADSWKAVFDPMQVLTLHLEINTNDWERVRFDQPSQSESWVPQVAEAMFWADGETPIRVSVRRKGESDTPLPEGNPQKVSLKIDINELVADQKWRGLTKLSLENGSESPLTEGFAWVLHRLAWEAGIYGYEAAYSGWVRLFINGELKGIFINAEQRDAQFLRNHGYDKTGGTWLYKIDGSSMLEVGTGRSPTLDHLCYAPFSSGPGGGTSGGCAQPNLEADLPLWVNLQGFFTLAAVNAFTENKDDLFSHSGKNSYAVDFNPPWPRTRLYFPWDLDTTVFQGNGSIYGSEPYQVQLLMHPWYRCVYEQTLRDLIDGPFSAAALHSVINRMQTNLGPALDEDPYVYGGGSAGAFEELHSWVDRRVASVRSQLTQPWIPAPQLSQRGGEVVAGFNLVMSAPVGAVYYTLDGSDPRAPGGLPAAGAFQSTAPLIVERSTHIIARAYDGTNWSALPVTADFSIARYANQVRITELMYHPRVGALPEDEYEFVELKNTGAEALNLSGYYFEGIDYSFPAASVLPAGSFYVLARNATAFSNRYPNVMVNGVYWGKLSDSGEKMRLRDAQGNTVVSVEYDDDTPWPLTPDALGHSLVLADLAGDPDQPATWRSSSMVHGSPGADDPAPPYGLGVVINEVLAHTDPPLEDAIELFNTGSSAVDISGWYLSDNFARTNVAGAFGLKQFRIPAGIILPAGGYKVFYAHDFQSGNTLVPFGLSELGESVYLSSATGSGELTGYVMGATFGASENGVSIGRHPTSSGVDFVPLSRITFGLTGSGALNAAPAVGPVVINEIMYNPTASGVEYVELLNLSGAPVNLGGWKVAGADFTFPSGATIAGSGLLLLVKTNTISVEAFRAAHQLPAGLPIFAADFVLENEGEAIRLEKPNTAPQDPPYEVERVRYNDKSPWPPEADGEGPSLERFSSAGYGNDPINWRTVQSGGSPGRVNQFPVGVAVLKGSAWKYHDAGSNLGTAWRGLDYSDSGWPVGDGPLGYGAAALGTVLVYGTDASNKPVTAYLRKEFVVNDPISSITNLQLEALYDDGFVLYLNGIEILRSGSMPAGDILHSTTTTAGYNSIGYEAFDLSAFISLLRTGENVLGVEVHQESPSSVDLLWDGALKFDVTSQPTVLPPVITPTGGIFPTPVVVTLETLPADAEVRYTVNGTEPDEMSALYTGAFVLNSSAEVRARGYKPGYNDSGVASALFVVGVPGYLEVPSPAGLSASGFVGGPFTPALTRYVLTNSGGAVLNWLADKSQTWVTVSPAGGTLPVGAMTEVTVAFDLSAGNLAPGDHTALISLVNATTGLGTTNRSVQLQVSRASTSLSAELLTSGNLQLRMEGRSHQAYLLEATVDFVQWDPILTNATAADGVLIHTEPKSSAPGGRFYRARLLP